MLQGLDISAGFANTSCLHNTFSVIKIALNYQELSVPVSNPLITADVSYGAQVPLCFGYHT